MMFNATFNNISGIFWAVNFIAAGNRNTWGKPPTLSKVTDRLYNIMLYRVHLAMNGVRTTLMVIGTDFKGSCKSNYHMITTTTVPRYLQILRNQIYLKNAKQIKHRYTHLIIGRY